MVRRTLFCRGCFGGGPLYIATARTAQKIPLPTVLLLLLDVAIGTDRVENTASHNYLMVTRVSVAAFTLRLLSHCLAMAVFTEPFPINRCLRWLNNSGFQHTFHNMKRKYRKDLLLHIDTYFATHFSDDILGHSICFGH
jgi:hypothetical protein